MKYYYLYKQIQYFIQSLSHYFHHTHAHTTMHTTARTHANERKCARQVANGPTLQRKPTYLNEFTLSKHNQTSKESRPESNRNEGHHVVSEHHF